MTDDLSRFILEVRPTGGVHPISSALAFVRLSDPVLLVGSDADIERFAVLAPRLAYGSAVLFSDLSDGGFARVDQIAATSDFRTWVRGPDFTGLAPGTRTWVKSFYDGLTYTTHLPHLRKAVELTTGPVLELGAGEGSTPLLHELCTKAGRRLVTVESDRGWLERFESMASELHTLVHHEDPAWVVAQAEPPWGVIFIDHAPGKTRRDALERASGKADFILVHDTEDLGYGLEDLLSSFRYRKDFRYSRPWTTAVSGTRVIW